MNGDYQKMCALENIGRAYRWIQSNPDVSYKDYFRDTYAAYAAASGLNLKRLRKHLLRHTYTPGHAAKIYLPKPSGILRPYTLLTVNDQLAYQACVNVIADKLKPRTKQRYLKTVFGHLYAGKSSSFFYLKWQKGYRAYSDSVLKNINDGYKFVANFDLAAFYDSIDHNVLAYFLKELKVDEDLIEFLLDCLKIWTSSTWTHLSNVIYHKHGIPQGPLSSGLLSEVILRHIDEDTYGVKRSQIKYLRYVDDIKIFAKSEELLRQCLVTLDLRAKEIGLFPQSSKINIRKVVDPLEEIKTVSRPPEPSLKPAPNQIKLRARLLQLTRSGKVKSEHQTRFKYLIARSTPSCRLNKRLLEVLRKQPALCPQISYYFSRYIELPEKAAEEIYEFIVENEVYHAVKGSMLLACLENMPDPYRTRCIDFCYRRLVTPRKRIPQPQPTYKASLMAWILRNNRVTYAELEKLFNNEMDWWVKKDVLKYIKKDHYGVASYEAFMKKVAMARDTEPARIAALKLVENDLNIPSPTRSAHESARLLLFAAGKIRQIGRSESLVGPVFRYVLNHDFAHYDWGAFFAARHRDAEIIAFTVKRSFESDINSCIVTIDSFCDLMWEILFRRYVPGTGYGMYGSMLRHPTMTAVFPIASSVFDQLHKLRLQSVTAHPRNTKTGLATRRLKHYDFYSIRPHLCDAFSEIIGNVAP